MDGRPVVVSATPVGEPQAVDAASGLVGDVVMMSGRPYVRRPVAWHGAYFAEELVPLEEARG